MTLKRFTLALVLLALLLPVAATVSAADAEPPLSAAMGRYLAQSSIIQEATGLDATAIMSALQDGSSIAQLIEAKGADIEAVIASLVGEATDQINESKDAAISRLPEAINQQLDRRWHWRFKSHSPVFFSMFRKGESPQETDEADDAEARETPAEGVSLLALIQANGGDIDGLMTDLVAEATAEINESATSRIESLEDTFREQLNATSADRWRRRWRFGRPRLPLPNNP